MSFETKHYKNSAFQIQNQSNCSSSIQEKDSFLDLCNQGFSKKKFQRSQSKELFQARINSSLIQRPSLGSGSGLNKCNSSYSSFSSKSSKTLSYTSPKRFDTAFISNSKFIPETFKQKTTQQYIDLSDLRKDERNSDLSNRNYGQKGLMNIQKEDEGFYPFKHITGSSKMVTPQIVLKQTFSTKTIKLEQSPLKDVSFFIPKNQRAQKSEITNFSTQPSICQFKVSKKHVTFGLQTDSKHFINSLTNTDPIKVNSMKIQTNQTNKSYEKLIESMQIKIDQLDKDKKELANKLTSSLKQNQILSKLLKDAESKNFFKKPSFNQTFTPKSLNVSINKNRQADLQNQIKELKEQNSALKNHKFEEIIETIQLQNASLSKQLQTMSLKCRILEQYNNQAVTFEQQNRKLKTDVKYFRANIKQLSSQIERLKKENKKLRMNNFSKQKCLEGQKFCPWGSQTDSLNLSISIVRQ